MRESVAVRADDEVLGCSGTLAVLSDAESRVHVAFIEDGVSSQTADYSVNNGDLISWCRSAKIACHIPQVRSVSFRDFSDNYVDTVVLLQLAQTVARLTKKHNPHINFTHYADDLNIDHRKTDKAVVAVCRPQCNAPVKTLLRFEMPSSTEWQLSSSGAVIASN